MLSEIEKLYKRQEDRKDIMNKVYIVMYHYVRNLKGSRYPNIKGLDYALFKKQIQFFSQKFNVIAMEDIIRYYTEGYSLPQNALLLTFDDGYIDNYTYVWPILLEYKMQGSFFIPAKTFCENCLLDVNKIHFILASTSIDNLCRELYEQLNYYRGGKWNYPSNEELFNKYAVANRFDTKEIIFFKRILQVVLPEELRSIISSNIFKKYVGISEEVMAQELYMNYDQMRLIKKQGGFFGIHGYNHYWMNYLGKDELLMDIDLALHSMGELVDKKEQVINYPYGSYSAEIIEWIQGKGCVLGLSTDVKVANLEEENRFALPRLDTNDFPPKSERFQIIQLDMMYLLKKGIKR